jgi:drug/metabolite transporter (DMT)-like permease
MIWASFRVMISFLFLLIISIVSNHKKPKITTGFISQIVIFALLGVIINQGSFLVGLKYTTATNSAILNTLIPIFTLLLVTLSGKETLTLKRSLGFVSALTGVLVLRHIENFTLSDDTLLGDALTILNCFSYALFLTLSKRFIGKYNPLWVTTWLFGFGSIGLMIFAAPSWSQFQWPEFNITIIGCMMFSIFGSTLLAYLLNNWALAKSSSSSVALFIYLQPVIASGLAWGFFGESITPRTVLAALFIFSGMLLAS